MLPAQQRITILELHQKGNGKREIARLLGISRTSVRQVLQSNSATPPKLAREEKAAPYRAQILELWAECKGNLVRVHEELQVQHGAALSYAALTAFCRRAGIGQAPVEAAGRYEFEPGEEIQHDTSQHVVTVGGKQWKAQTASAVLCHSRMLFFQIQPNFDRFQCKVFLTEAFRYFGGAAKRVMIDNTHVVVLRGTGSEMQPVPEMLAFAERFGFEWKAHERGDANRSARVERPFHFIENNFLAGRQFADWDDVNQQARQWCERVNGTYKKHIRAIPRELYAQERTCLTPLPTWIPEHYRLHQRTVDTEGYVSLHSVRYSAPLAWIGRSVEVRETLRHVELQLDARTAAVQHRRVWSSEQTRATLPEHRPEQEKRPSRKEPPAEQAALLQLEPTLAKYVEELKSKGRKNTALLLRQLLRMCREYPRAAFCGALEEAARYGLYDLDRVERMILKRVQRDFFEMPEGEEP